MQLAAGVAGALILGPVGFGLATAGTGFAVGTALYGVFGPRPKGPGPGDLSTPGVSLGSLVPRPYGQVRVTLSPMWMPDEFRKTEHSAGGKGTPSGPSSYTFDTDVLSVAADGKRVLAITREWWNKKLIFTALATSTAASLEASTTTDYYASRTDQLGGVSQTPWSVYEDAVTAADAPAYRHMLTIGHAGVQCGTSKSLPLMEAEIITNGTPADVDIDALVKLQVQFATDASDESAYNHTPTVTGSPTYGGVFQTDLADGVMKAAWGSTDMARASADDAWTMQADFIAADLAVTSSWVNNLVCGYGWTEAATSPYFRIELLYIGGAPSVSASFAGTRVGVTTITLGDPYRAAIRYLPGVSPVVQFVLSGVVIHEADATLYGDFVSTPATNGDVDIGRGDDPFNEARQFSVDSLRLKNAVVDLGDLTTPGTLPPPDAIGQYTTWTPLPETLDDVLTEELSLIPGLDMADYDVTDVASVEVRGFLAIGEPRRVIAELLDLFYVDFVPGSPNRFVRKGSAAVGSISYANTGAGVGKAATPFDGLKLGNNDEISGVKALAYPDINRDHNRGFQRGDRLTTDGPDVARIETQVVFTAEEAQGRAMTATLVARMRKQSAEFAITNRRAEPADAFTVTDRDGDSYRLKIAGLTQTDGVQACKWELEETSMYIASGAADMSDEPGIEIEIPGDADLLALDMPLQRVADDGAGYLAAVKCSDDSRVYLLESPTDVTYTEVAQFPLDAVFGSVSAINGTPAVLPTDTGSSVTVDVGDGTLSAITDAVLLQDNAANRFVMGVHGRWVVGQFRDCTLSAPGVYVLSGFLWGLNGTAQYVDDLVTGDSFCLLNEAGGVQPIEDSNAELGVAKYVKAVPERRTQASITGEAFTNTGVALKPLPGINPHAARDAGTGDITITWDRQTRHPTRFGGDLGDSCPLGEESERYQVRLYTDATFATLVRAFDVATSATVTYTSAHRTTDSHTPITAALYVDVRQLSAAVGEGYALQATL
jgi:hypothetical protein